MANDAHFSLRLLGPGDRADCERHLLRLSAEGRWLRFTHSVGDAFLCGHCQRIDWSRDLLVGAFVGPTLRGLAELYRLPGGPPGAAELGLSVQPPYQNRGIGSALLRRSLLVARNRWISRVYMTCHWENTKMRRIATRMGAGVTSDEDETSGALRLLWPTCLSVLEEMAS